MPRKRYPPTDSREWLNRARGNLAIAQAVIPDAWLEDLCFEAQQCVEKALKGIFVARGQSFPYVHDLRKLLQLLEQHGVKIPKFVWGVDELSDYAVLTRYPDIVAPVSQSNIDASFASPKKFCTGQNDKFRPARKSRGAKSNWLCPRSRSLPTLATLDALTAPGLLVAEMETLHLRFMVE